MVYYGSVSSIFQHWHGCSYYAGSRTTKPPPGSRVNDGLDGLRLSDMHSDKVMAVPHDVMDVMLFVTAQTIYQENELFLANP